MRRHIAAILILGGAAACAPAPPPEAPVSTGRQSDLAAVASFDFRVKGSEVSGAFDPRIFTKDGVLTHARRACVGGFWGNYAETRRTTRVAFRILCRGGVLPEARGRWTVNRLGDGDERAIKL